MKSYDVASYENRDLHTLIKVCIIFTALVFETPYHSVGARFSKIPQGFNRKQILPNTWRVLLILIARTTSKRNQLLNVIITVKVVR